MGAIGNSVADDFSASLAIFSSAEHAAAMIEIRLLSVPLLHSTFSYLMFSPIHRHGDRNVSGITPSAERPASCKPFGPSAETKIGAGLSIVNPMPARPLEMSRDFLARDGDQFYTRFKVLSSAWLLSLACQTGPSPVPRPRIARPLDISLSAMQRHRRAPSDDEDHIRDGDASSTRLVICALASV